jgi:C4-dicarboxylate-specific signal transduction histidine kinase
MSKHSAIENIGLAFFGRVSASISHEIKNTLAIINENAGLLEDLTLLAEKGIPISTERLQRLSATLKAQVDRTDKIIKKMNRFSHSTDQTIQPVDIYETTVFVTELCDRLTRMHNLKVEVIHPEHPVIVSSNLFCLEHMIWACIEFMIKAAETGKIITITIEKLSTGAQIRLNGLDTSETVSPEIFPSDAEKALRDALDAEIRFDSENGCILIILPKEIR